MKNINHTDQFTKLQQQQNNGFVLLGSLNSFLNSRTVTFKIKSNRDHVAAHVSHTASCKLVLFGVLMGSFSFHLSPDCRDRAKGGAACREALAPLLF